VLARIVRKINDWVQSPADYVDLGYAVARSWVGSPDYARARWAGSVPLEAARRVAVFHHFDERGLIHDYVVFFVRKLAEAGFAVIFTSNARRLTEQEAGKVLPHVSVVLKRANVGWDFGAYKDAIAMLPDPGALEMLLITNDSVYGPLQDLSGAIAAADPAQAEIWGITDSWDRYFHLQSYFLIFHQAALRHPAFRSFWSKVRYYRRKWWVIKHYEVGLTRYFLRHGLRCRALFPYRSIVANVSTPIELGMGADSSTTRGQYLRLLHNSITSGSPLNQTHYFWDYLIGQGRCPFIKRDLLQKNPVGIPYVQRWEEVLKAASSYDTELIVRHLQMTMRNRVY